jgi:hypothetical protein
LCETINLVVGDRDGVTDTLGSWSSLAVQPLSKHRERNIGGFSTGSLASHAIDNEEKATRRVAMEPIFINIALTAWIR